MESVRMLEPSLVDYSRQAEFDQSVNYPHEDVATAVVIGCGGVGFWAAIMLAMLGWFKHMFLFDKELIESSNLNRLPVPQKWIGKPKVRCLKSIIHTLRPDIAVTAIKCNVVDDTMNILQEVLGRWERISVIDTTDDARAQAKIYREVKKGSVLTTYVKLGYEGNRIGMVKELEAWIPDDYRPGYRTTNANVITSAVAAGVGLYKLILGSNADLIVDLAKLVNNEPEHSAPSPGRVGIRAATVRTPARRTRIQAPTGGDRIQATNGGT